MIITLRENSHNSPALLTVAPSPPSKSRPTAGQLRYSLAPHTRDRTMCSSSSPSRLGRSKATCPRPTATSCGWHTRTGHLVGKTLRLPEDVYFQGPEGKRVHGFVVEPHGWKEDGSKKWLGLLFINGGTSALMSPAGTYAQQGFSGPSGSVR